MIKNYNELLEDLRKEVDAGEHGAEDLFALTESIGEASLEFISESALGTSKNFENPNEPIVACESLGLQLNTIGVKPIANLVEKAGIPAEYKVAACETVLQVLAKHASTDTSAAWRDQSISAESYNAEHNYNDMSEILGYSGNAFLTQENTTHISKESFGVDVDKATPDLRLDITIALLRFHSDLTMAMLPTRTTNEPVVRYKRLNAAVYDLVDPKVKPIQIVDLYENGAAVENKLVRVVPKASAPDTLAEGIIAANRQVELFPLTVDANRPGFTSFNHTDLIAEGVELDTIFVKITDGTNSDTVRIKLPTSTFKYIWANESKDQFDRVINRDYSFFLKKDTLTSTGGACTLLANAPDNVSGLRLKLFISGKINLKSGEVLTSVSGSVKADTTDGSPVDADVQTIADNVNDNNGITGVSYILDAYFAERHNFRKATIGGTSSVQTIFYEIRPGRTYQWDYAHGQTNVQENMAILGNVLRIGQGYITLNSVVKTLDHIVEVKDSIARGLLEEEYGPTHVYAAGSRVRPHVIKETIDLAPLTSNNDIYQSENIRAHFLVALNAIVSQLAAITFLNQQVAGASAVHYRAVTSNEILDNVITQNYGPDHTVMHQENKGAIERSVLLPCGAQIDFVTTTEKEYGRKIVMYPMLEPSSSELNLGQNWNYGQLSGHYPVSSDDGRVSYNRLYTSTRETFIPTNPTGAIITVENLEQVVFRNGTATP